MYACPTKFKHKADKRDGQMIGSSSLDLHVHVPGLCARLVTLSSRESFFLDFLPEPAGSSESESEEELLLLPLALLDELEPLHTHTHQAGISAGEACSTVKHT